MFILNLRIRYYNCEEVYLYFLEIFTKKRVQILCKTFIMYD